MRTRGHQEAFRKRGSLMQYSLAGSCERGCCRVFTRVAAARCVVTGSSERYLCDRILFSDHDLNDQRLPWMSRKRMAFSKLQAPSNFRVSVVKNEWPNVSLWDDCSRSLSTLSLPNFVVFGRVNLLSILELKRQNIFLRYIFVHAASCIGIIPRTVALTNHINTWLYGNNNEALSTKPS